MWPSLQTKTWKSLCKHVVSRIIAFNDLTFCSSACINLASFSISTIASIPISLVLFFHPFIKKHEDDGQERTGCTSTLPSRKRVDALVCQWRGCSVL